MCWLSRSGGNSWAFAPSTARSIGWSPWRWVATASSRASRLENCWTCRPWSSSWCCMAWRVSSWRSSSAARRPSRAARGSGSPSSRVFGRLRLIQNSEPSPGLLVTPISPPICSTRRLEITRPRPVPPAWRVIELSAWLKAWNRLRSSSSARPMPVSCTLMRSWARSALSSSTMARTTMVPLWVNLMALLTRLVRICLSRCGSPISDSGVSR
ncbi:hypothetical protein D9M68_579320 [compost metagenome]